MIKQTRKIIEMKFLLLPLLFCMITLGYSQSKEVSQSVTNQYNSSYPGPRLGQGSKKFVGNIPGKEENNFSNLWNQVTPGGDGKWEKVGITADSTKWNWEPITKLYNYAKVHQIQFKFHTLIWGRQQPKWISALSPDEQLKYITTWISQVGKRFPDAEMVDVVNEALPKHWPPDGRPETVNYIKALGGEGKTGYDWVIKSFELARKYIPKAKLILNDYSIINNDTNTKEYIRIVKLLAKRNLIDGIGIQAHRFELSNVPVAKLKVNLDRLAATGIPIYISEMDLGNRKKDGDPSDTEQLELYQTIFPVLWEHPSVAGITFWGYLEGKMWLKNCQLIRTDGTWRPAMIWLADYLAKNPR
jgi:endo-1,4-beta-xylanase